MCCVAVAPTQHICVCTGRSGRALYLQEMTPPTNGTMTNMPMETEGRYGVLQEEDITGLPQEPIKKKAKGLLPDSVEITPPGYLCAHFKADTKLRTQGDKYRWVSQALKLDPYNRTKGSIELKIGRNYVYVRCQIEQILPICRCRW